MDHCAFAAVLCLRDIFVTLVQLVQRVDLQRPSYIRNHGRSVNTDLIPDLFF